MTRCAHELTFRYLGEEILRRSTYEVRHIGELLPTHMVEVHRLRPKGAPAVSAGSTLQPKEKSSVTFALTHLARVAQGADPCREDLKGARRPG